MSDAKLAANRANAKKSTGPRTDAGKRKAAMNAVRHGLCAKSVCVHGEQSDAFNALVAEFVREHQPTSSTEYALVYRLAVASWNLRRLTEAETSLIDAATSCRKFEDGKWVEKRLPIGEAMLKAMKDDQRFNALQLYQQRLERAFYRALVELRQLRKDRENRADEDAADVQLEGQVAAMMSDRAPDEPTAEMPAPTTDTSSPLAAETARIAAAASDNAIEADDNAGVETESEQTNPTLDSQVEPKPSVTPPRPAANEPTAAVTGPIVTEMDMRASNLRRAQRGLPMLYPQFA